jgi:hypothetical protein
MKHKKPTLTEDQVKIRKIAERNNDKIRKHWKPTYTRIKREKKNKFWRFWYRLFG